MPHSECPDCEATDIVEETVTHPFEYGAKPTVVLHATHPVFRCKGCGYQWADYRAEEAQDQAVKDFNNGYF